MMILNPYIFGGATGYIVDDYSPEYCWTVERVDLADTDLVNVRRSGDSAESAFNGTEISDGSLVTWVVAGGGTEDGLVVDWYNVGTAGALTLTQATATEQPKLVSGGVLNTKNSQPSALYDGSNDENSSTSQILDSQPFSVFGVASNEASAQSGLFFSNRSTTNTDGIIMLADRRTNKLGFFIEHLSDTNAFNYPSQINTNDLRLQTFTIDNSNNGELWKNSTSQATATLGSYFYEGTGKTIMIGGQALASQRRNVNVSMILAFDSDETSNRTDIETAINTIYSIY